MRLLIDEAIIKLGLTFRSTDKALPFYTLLLLADSIFENNFLKLSKLLQVIIRMNI